MKKAKKRIVSLLMVLLLFTVSALNVLAYNGPAETAQRTSAEAKVLDSETIITELSKLKNEFPEADISVAEAIDFANEMAKLPVQERIDYYKKLYEEGPKEEYMKRNPDGRYTVLRVYAPLGIEWAEFTPGSSTVSSGITYYTGSKVKIHNLIDFLYLNIQYNINHYEYSSGVGVVTSAYSLGGNGNGVFTPGNLSFLQTSGTQVIVRTEIFQLMDGEIESVGVVRNTFNINTRSSSSTWI